MSHAAKFAGLALATMAVSFAASPSFAQSGGYGAAVIGAYHNGPIRAGDRCWVATDRLRGYGHWGECKKPARAARTAPAASAQFEHVGYRSGHNGPTRVGDNCWIATDKLRGYGHWGECKKPARAARTAPAAYAHFEQVGYQSGHNGPTRVGDSCWIATDKLRGYGHWGACPARR
jgi:hypothetical protein